MIIHVQRIFFIIYLQLILEQKYIFFIQIIFILIFKDYHLKIIRQIITITIKP